MTVKKLNEISYSTKASMIISYLFSWLVQKLTKIEGLDIRAKSERHGLHKSLCSDNTDRVYLFLVNGNNIKLNCLEINSNFSVIFIF